MPEHEVDLARLADILDLPSQEKKVFKALRYQKFVSDANLIQLLKTPTQPSLQTACKNIRLQLKEHGLDIYSSRQNNAKAVGPLEGLEGVATIPYQVAMLVASQVKNLSQDINRRERVANDYFAIFMARPTDREHILGTILSPRRQVLFGELWMSATQNGLGEISAIKLADLATRILGSSENEKKSMLSSDVVHINAAFAAINISLRIESVRTGNKPSSGYFLTDYK